MNCHSDPLVVLTDRFRCDRLAGRPTLSVGDCAARWRRAQRPAAEDPYRPASFAACKGCSDGAARNGTTVAEAPRPASTAKPDLGEARREVLARVVRVEGRVALPALMAACSDAGLDAGLTQRQAERITRWHLGKLIEAGRVRRLAKGLYGNRRATPPPSRWSLAVAWVDDQARGWSPADLQAALIDTLRDSTRPRQRVHKLLRRLIREGEVERVGLGVYARSGLMVALPPVPRQMPLFPTLATQARGGHRHEPRDAEPVQATGTAAAQLGFDFAA